MIGKRSLATLAILSFVSLGLAGCEMFDNNDKNHDKDDIKVSNRDYSDMRLPDKAERMTSGTGESISWKADRAGTVYVVDQDDNNRVAYSKHVTSDQKIMVDAANDRISLDGTAVSTRDLKRDHRYGIYFDKDR